MVVIHKYAFERGQSGMRAKIPCTATKPGLVLMVALQHGVPTLWVEVPSEPTREQEREFKIVPTGIDYDDTLWAYRGSVFDGPFVWHVLEKV